VRRVAYMTPLYFGADAYLGGGERFPLNVAKAVASTGHYEVELVSFGASDEQVLRPLADGVTLRLLPVAARAPGAAPLSWDVLPVLAEADLVHVHQIFSRSGEVAVLTAKLMGKPVVVSDHGGASSWLGRSLGMLDVVDRVLTYSEFGATLIDAPGGVSTIPGGVDDHFFTPPAAEAAPVRDHVMFVGRLLPHKGVDRLITALPDDVALTVCGTPHREDYTALLTALARGKRVEFVSGADDAQLRDLYRRALCVVLPSVYVDCYGGVSAWPELMGLAFLEGMACGAPAICSRVGAMPEFVRHGETGFVFDELGELTGAIRRLADDPDLVAALGDAAHRTVNANFGLDAVGASTAELYDELLAAVPA
jgi:glycosyltransferase involved in cell wall biosynthesis